MTAARNTLLAALLGAAIALAAGARAAPPARVVFFGDSITAGYGLPDPAVQAYPARVAELARADGLPISAVNAGLSGETSAGGLRRIDWVLAQPVDALVLELGGNDGLRGTDPAETERNLQAIIDRVRARRPAAAIVVAGMRMPASMGPDYAEAFRAVYERLASRNHTPLIPFVLDGIAGRAELMQADSIHPNAEGARLVARTVWAALRGVLEGRPRPPSNEAPR